DLSLAMSMEQQDCPLCREYLRDPVSIPCGHTFCSVCIKTYWDHADHTGTYSCPHCKVTYNKRPVPRRSQTLTRTSERVRTSEPSPPAPPAPDYNYAGPQDVPCDICTGRKHKAVKSCLMCLASYCERHLKAHFENTTFKRHKLVDEIGHLDRQICPQHQKGLELYCRTDQMCICVLCTVKEHKGHDMVSAETERVEKQNLLSTTQAEIQQRIQDRVKQMEELKHAVDALKTSAQRALAESEKLFGDMLRSIERMQAEMSKLISSNKRAALTQAEGHLERLEQEVADLKKRDSELTHLSRTEDHIHFIQSFHTLCEQTEAEELPNVTVNPYFSFGAVTKTVSEMKVHLNEFTNEEMVKVTKTGHLPYFRSISASFTRSWILIYDINLRIMFVTYNGSSFVFSTSPACLSSPANEIGLNSAPSLQPRQRGEFLKLFGNTEQYNLQIIVGSCAKNCQEVETARSGSQLQTPTHYSRLHSRKIMTEWLIQVTVSTMNTQVWSVQIQVVQLARQGQVIKVPGGRLKCLVYMMRFLPLDVGVLLFLELILSCALEFCVFWGTKSCFCGPAKNKHLLQLRDCFCVLRTMMPTLRSLFPGTGNRKAALKRDTQPYSDHPQRFDCLPQVLCKEPLSGGCYYWEVEWSGEGASIGIAYKGMKRSGYGDSCRIGYNKKSWSLFCSDSSYSARHDKDPVEINAPYCSRIGVLLDHGAGTLSFYSVSDTMSLIHRFKATFNEPVYAGFWVWYESAVTICQL
ncbi:TRI47 protein, partial [Atractosteus spatula]|nr:TRI47 protein [Atractosteus spatula]